MLYPPRDLTQWDLRAWNGAMVGKVICPARTKFMAIRERLAAMGWGSRVQTNMSQYSVPMDAVETWPVPVQTCPDGHPDGGPERSK